MHPGVKRSARRLRKRHRAEPGSCGGGLLAPEHDPQAHAQGRYRADGGHAGNRAADEHRRSRQSGRRLAGGQQSPQHMQAGQQAVAEASEPEHPGATARPHTLCRVIVPDELMDECKELIDDYLERNPESATAERLPDPVTAEIVVGELLQNFKMVLTGECAEMVRQEIERDDEDVLVEGIQDPYSDDGHRFVSPVSDPRRAQGLLHLLRAGWTATSSGEPGRRGVQQLDYATIPAFFCP